MRRPFGRPQVRSDASVEDVDGVVIDIEDDSSIEVDDDASVERHDIPRFFLRSSKINEHDALSLAGATTSHTCTSGTRSSQLNNTH
jgi:hypothetical protein